MKGRLNHEKWNSRSGTISGGRSGGRDLFVEAGFTTGRRIRGWIHLDYEERGVATQPTTETHYEVATRWEIELGDAFVPWRMTMGLGYRRIKNADYIPDETRNLFLIQAGITARM